MSPQVEIVRGPGKGGGGSFSHESSGPWPICFTSLEV